MMNFKHGETIYHIHAFPFDGKFYVVKATVVVIGTKFKTTSSPSMIVKYSERTYDSEISLRDANVIPNTYNCHRIFKTKLEAENYVNSPILWRPLGFSAEEWEHSRKAEYLADKAYNEMMDDMYNA